MIGSLKNFVWGTDRNDHPRFPLSCRRIEAVYICQSGVWQYINQVCTEYGGLYGSIVRSFECKLTSTVLHRLGLHLSG